MTPVAIVEKPNQVQPATLSFPLRRLAPWMCEQMCDAPKAGGHTRADLVKLVSGNKGKTYMNTLKAKALWKDNVIAALETNPWQDENEVARFKEVSDDFLRKIGVGFPPRSYGAEDAFVDFSNTYWVRSPRAAAP